MIWDGWVGMVVSQKKKELEEPTITLQIREGVSVLDFESLADKESQPSPASSPKMLLIFAHK